MIVVHTPLEGLFGTERPDLFPVRIVHVLPTTTVLGTENVALLAHSVQSAAVAVPVVPVVDCVPGIAVRVENLEL
ncbi:hypothetical protein JCM18237_26320 [Halorubrum luteum]